MVPAVSARNRTPSSTALVSLVSIRLGVADAGQIVEGAAAAAAATTITAVDEAAVPESASSLDGATTGAARVTNAPRVGTPLLLTRNNRYAPGGATLASDGALMSSPPEIGRNETGTNR